MNPNTSATLKFGLMDCVLVTLATWLPASKCCGKPSTEEYPKGARWDHAVVVTSMPAYPSTSPGNRDRYGLVGYEISRLGDENIFWEVQGWREIGDSPRGINIGPFGSLAVNNA